MDRDRLEMFADGVVGIIISLLILKICHHADWDSLSQSWQALIALPLVLYFGAFAGIAFIVCSVLD